MVWYYHDQDQDRVTLHKAFRHLNVERPSISKLTNSQSRCEYSSLLAASPIISIEWQKLCEEIPITILNPPYQHTAVFSPTLQLFQLPK